MIGECVSPDDRRSMDSDCPQLAYGRHSQEKTTEKTLLRLSLACRFSHSLGQEGTHALQHDRKQKDRLAAVSPKLARPTSSPGFARAIKLPA
jgi:hypothetical protein